MSILFLHIKPYKNFSRACDLPLFAWLHYGLAVAKSICLRRCRLSLVRAARGLGCHLLLLRGAARHSFTGRRFLQALLIAVQPRVATSHGRRPRRRPSRD
jgi:hypothetical protein